MDVPEGTGTDLWMSNRSRIQIHSGIDRHELEVPGACRCWVVRAQIVASMDAVLRCWLLNCITALELTLTAKLGAR